MNVTLSFARIEKSTLKQPYCPVSSDYANERKSLSRYKYVPELNGVVAGQAIFSSLAVSHVATHLSKLHTIWKIPLFKVYASCFSV